MKMFAFAVASAALISLSSSAFAGHSTRGAFAAIDARQAQQDQRQAYALTGEQVRMQRQDHAALTRQIHGGRNAR